MSRPRPPQPSRWRRPSWRILATLLLGCSFLFWSLAGLRCNANPADIARTILQIADQMWPPSLSRLEPVSRSLLQTFEMAWIGTTLGLPFSLALALLAARNTSPHPLLQAPVRALLTLLRTTPPLVLAILLIAAVGLGPRAGTITLMLTTIGFCGRFFAEALEEVSPEPGEALMSLGASRSGLLCCAILPAALPSLVNTTLYNLEHATRASTVLGIVGAGGIGIELMVSLQTLRYDEAASIIVLVFAMVMAVEQCCTRLRHLII